jgi:hypothetical protein
MGLLLDHLPKAVSEMAVSFKAAAVRTGRGRAPSLPMRPRASATECVVRMA